MDGIALNSDTFLYIRKWKYEVILLHKLILRKHDAHCNHLKIYSQLENLFTNIVYLILGQAQVISFHNASLPE